MKAPEGVLGFPESVLLLLFRDDRYPPKPPLPLALPELEPPKSPELCPFGLALPILLFALFAKALLGEVPELKPPAKPELLVEPLLLDPPKPEFEAFVEPNPVFPGTLPFGNAEVLFAFV